MESLKPYLKFVVSFLAAAATVALTYASDDQITANEWALIVLAGLAAVGVYVVPNTPKPPPPPVQ